MRLIKFSADHLAALQLQRSQEGLSSVISDIRYGQSLETPWSFTGVHGDTIIGCAGAVELWPNRACLWALLSPDAGRHFLTIHRAVEGFLKVAPWQRIEATVDVRFEAGQRWIRMLNFQLEGRLRRYTPDGQDHDLFSRVK